MSSKVLRSTIAAALATVSVAVSAPTSAQESLDITQALDEIAREAEAAAEEAMKPENIERRRREDQTVIDNAMRQLASSSDPSLANKLLLPETASLTAMESVLKHPNAWETPSRAHHENDALIESMTTLSMRAGYLLYDEWACNTGRMENVARQYIDLIDQLVTVYPERVFLRNAMRGRDILGYPRTKSCSYTSLKAERIKFQAAVGAVLNHSAPG